MTIRRHTLYSMDDEPSYVLDLGPTRKKSRHLSCFFFVVVVFSSYMLLLDPTSVATHQQGPLIIINGKLRAINHYFPLLM